MPHCLWCFRENAEVSVDAKPCWDLLQDNLALERAGSGEKTRGGLEAAELTFCFGATGWGQGTLSLWFFPG